MVISEHGVEPNPDKVQAVLGMTSPRNVKEVQRLNGRIAALSRFVSRAGDRCTPLFRVIRKDAQFDWTPECEEAFQKLKRYLASSLVMTVPTPAAPLLFYLAVTSHSISAVLVLEEASNQKPVYYVS